MTADTDLDRVRRSDIAKQALDIDMTEDPYWLCNLKQGRGYHDGFADMLEMAEQLRADADALETAHGKIQAGEWVPAEAALYIADRAHFGEYDTHDHLYDEIPIQERDGDGE